MAFIFFGFGSIPSAVTKCPKYSSSGFKNSHLSGCILSPNSLSRCSTMAKFLLCSCIVDPNIIMSSRYAKQCLLIGLRNAVSIIR